MSSQYGEFRPIIAAEICWRVWGTLQISTGFSSWQRYCMHGILVVGVSHTLRRWTEGASYIRQGGQHVGYWPTFLVVYSVSTSMPAKSQQLAAPINGKSSDGNTTVQIIPSPVNICDTSMPMCLDTSAPVRTCCADSSVLVPNCPGSELSRVRSVCTPV